MQYTRIKKIDFLPFMSDVTEIYFHNHKLHGGREDWIDLSEAQDGSIFGYYNEKNNRLNISTQDNNIGILAPTSCEDFFFGASQVFVIELDNFYAFDTYSMAGMFRYLNTLVSVSFLNPVCSNNLVNTDEMFLGCLDLVDLFGLHNLDLTHVMSARRMFAWCEVLEELDFTKSRMPNCEYMTYMLYGCVSLEKFRVFGADVINVTDAVGMTERCGRLRIIVVDNLVDYDTPGYKFYDLIHEETDIRYGYSPPKRTPEYDGREEDDDDTYKQFAAKHVTTFGKIWHRNEEKLENVKRIFFCYDDVPKGVQPLDYSAAQDGSILGWIANKTDLHITSVEGKIIAAPTFCENMFAACYNVEVIQLLNFNTFNTKSFARMFYYLDRLQLIMAPDMQTQQVVTMESMFEGCVSLKMILGIESFDTTNVENYSRMFKRCETLETLNISTFQQNPNINAKEMIYGCIALKDLDMTGWVFNPRFMNPVTDFVAYCPRLYGENIRWEHIHGLSTYEWDVLFGNLSKEPPVHITLQEIRRQRVARSLQRIQRKKYEKPHR